MDVNRKVEPGRNVQQIFEQVVEVPDMQENVNAAARAPIPHPIANQFAAQALPQDDALEGAEIQAWLNHGYPGLNELLVINMGLTRENVLLKERVMLLQNDNKDMEERLAILSAALTTLQETINRGI